MSRVCVLLYWAQFLSNRVVSRKEKGILCIIVQYILKTYIPEPLESKA